MDFNFFYNFWTPGLSFWSNLERVSAGLGSLVFFFALLVVLPYYALVTLFRLRENQAFLRSMIFILFGSAAYRTIPLLLGQLNLPNPIRMGVNFFGGQILYWLPSLPAILLLTGYSMVYDLLQASNRQEVKYYMSSYPASIAFGFWGYSLTGNGWMAVIFFFLSRLWLATRWNSIIRQPYKLQRVLYFMVYDSLAVAAWWGSWMLWGIGWVSFLAGGVGFFIAAGALPYLLVRIFPIVGRQEWLPALRAAKQTDQVKRLEVELHQLERDALRKRTLKQLDKHVQKVGRAEAERRAGRLDLALPQLDEVINLLTKISSLIPEQKACLGAAYQSRAKIRLAKKEFNKAKSDYKEARRFIQVDEEMVGGLADYVATNRSTGAEHLTYCTDYIVMRRGKPADERMKRVHTYLESLCNVIDGLSAADAQRILGIAQKITAADPGLGFAHRATGQTAVILEEWDLALSSLETARSLDPNHKGLQSALGYTYLHSGRLAEARRAFEVSLQLDSNQPRLAHELGILILDRMASPEYLRAALHWLEKAASLDPRSALYQYDLARAHLQVGDPAYARPALEKAIELDRNHAGAHWLLADLLYDDRQWAAAIPHYRAALSAGNDSPDIRLKLGACLVETRQAKEGCEFLIALKDTHPDALLPLGRAHLALNEFDQAQSVLKAFFERNPRSGAACYYLGCTFAWIGATRDPSAYGEAERWLKKAMENDPQLGPRASLQLGHLHLRQGKIQEAIRAYLAASLASETQQQASISLARAYLSENRPAEARTVLDRLGKSCQNDPSIQYVLGLAAEMQGDLETARTAYRQAKAYGSLGVVLSLSGQMEEARNLLEMARSAGESSDRILYFLGLVRTKLGDHSGALKEWELLAKRHPDDFRLSLNITRLHYLIGAAHFQKGEYSLAAEAWERFYQVYSTDDLTRTNLQQVYLLSAFASLGTPDAARFIKKARETGADSTRCEYLLALDHLKAGRYKEGRGLLEGILKRNPWDSPSLYNLGIALLTEGQSQSAITPLSQAASSSDGELQIQSAWALAAAYARSRDWVHAAGAIEEILA